MKGPRELALFAGEPPSFALHVGVLAVARATEAGYELRWPW
ncbi:hypothetical protein DB30_04428 [Enhygromyxa salina]|uniref:Uncharacterized protein n=1 Tax=Enhygromyxa salina TaxID=215803 RepID=A0A0C2D4A2_9BACT|nr:hypothetical protein [Enhygromyxa salina]KIG16515.1 hypothetical protein DB30_04428 [Enhygromyxa salina]